MLPQINEHFLPMALRYMGAGVAPVRESAADAVVVFMRHNRKQAQRTDIYCKLMREFARAKAHTRRMSFIDACQYIVRRFSSRYAHQKVRSMYPTYDILLEITAQHSMA